MRKLKPQKKVVVPDPIYQSIEVTKLINQTMKKGKKALAQKLVYAAFKSIAANGKNNALEIFQSALANIKPEVELRSRKVGGARYQVPFKVRPERQLTLAIRWLLEAAHNQTGVSFDKCLKKAIVSAAKKEGSAFKKKETIQKMATANRAFAYYSW